MQSLDEQGLGPYERGPLWLRVILVVTEDAV
jgi:hypothetical protein